MALWDNRNSYEGYREPYEARCTLGKFEFLPFKVNFACNGTARVRVRALGGDSCSIGEGGFRVHWGGREWEI